MTYTSTTTIDAPFNDVVVAFTNGLQVEGFGLLCDIDAKTTLKAKLDINIGKYRILGACNPPLAHEGLTKERDLGVLLPCNVTVYETDTVSVVVSAVNPQQLVEIANNTALTSIATKACDRFERVLLVGTDDLRTGSEALPLISPSNLLDTITIVVLILGAIIGIP